MALDSKPATIKSDDPRPESQWGKFRSGASFKAHSIIVNLEKQEFLLRSDFHDDIAGPGIEGIVQGILNNLKQKILLKGDAKIGGADMSFLNKVETKTGVDALKAFHEIVDSLAKLLGRDKTHILTDFQVIDSAQFLKNLIDTLKNGKHLFHRVLEPSLFEIEKVLHQGHLVIEVVNERFRSLLLDIHIRHSYFIPIRG